MSKIKKNTYFKNINKANNKNTNNFNIFDFTVFFKFCLRVIIVPSPWYIWYLVNIFLGYNYMIPKVIGACTLSVLSFEACADVHWSVWTIYLSAFIMAVIMMLVYHYSNMYYPNILPQ